MLIKINVPILNTCTLDVPKESCAKLSHIHSDNSVQWCFLLLSHILIASAMSHDRLMQNDTWKKKRINPIWPFDIGRKQMKTKCILSVRKFNSMIFYRAFWLHQFFFFLEWLLSFRNKTRKFWSFCFVFRLFVCFGLFDWIYFPVYSNLRKFPWTKLTTMIWK